MQVGDFYEIWEKEEWSLGFAISAAKICDMRLTKRRTKKDDEDAPHMCGFPVHTRDAYFQRLIDAGKTVVVVSQKTNGSSSDKNKNVERFVEKIISPGTVVENLSEEKSNYYACIYAQELALGIALVDLSTGEVKVTELLPSELIDYLNMINPTEILVCGNINLDSKKFKLVHHEKKIKVNKLSECGKILSHIYELKSPSSNDEVYLSTLGLDRWRLAVLAFSNLVNHLSNTEYHLNLLRKLAIPKVTKRINHLTIPLNGVKSLEIFESQGDNQEDTLINCLDDCKTAMGRRTLRQWIKEPLVNKDEINKRLNKVEELIKHERFYPELKEVYDIARISRRLFLSHLLPFEMKQLFNSLNNCLVILKKENKKTEVEELNKLIKYLNSNINFKEISRNNEDYLFFKGEFNSKLKKEYDNLISLENQMYQVKNKYEQIIDCFYDGKSREFRIEYKKEVIKLVGPKGFAKSLKDKDKKIELMKSNSLDESLQKRLKETGNFLKINERANSVELIESDWLEISEKVFTAKQKYILKAYRLWKSFQQGIAEDYSDCLLKTGEAIGEIDVLSNFAKISVERDYTRPVFLNSDHATFEFKGVRHPVIELSNSLQEDFVPNDVSLDNTNDLMCIYGANSSGKSTLLKSVALNIILGQIGCFVASKSAKFTPFQAILTRMTTYDLLSEGLSTFTMEMVELKNALIYKNKRSLFLLDEIGRGTSVEDGEALAFATIDYLSTKESKSVVFFATHYHKLVEKLNTYDNIQINHMDCYVDDSGLIYFSRELEKGPGTGSYGIDVAQSCGLPEELVRVAKNYNKKYASLKVSRYNRNVKGVICPFCDNNPVQETHHIVDQKNGKIKWIQINGVKKSINHKDNLIMICGSCHNKITRKELILSSKRARIK